MAALLNKAVLKTNPVDKSVAKKLGRNSADYFNSLVSDPAEVINFRKLIRCFLGQTQIFRDPFEGFVDCFCEFHGKGERSFGEDDSAGFGATFGQFSNLEGLEKVQFSMFTGFSFVKTNFS